MVDIRKFERGDAQSAAEIWNEVVEDAAAFPQTEQLDEASAIDFFLSQSYTGIAFDSVSEETVGLYILHPNNIGRCGHICNASYAVKRSMRGRRIGEKLVIHCMNQAKALGFRILQFNAVVASNKTALSLYEKLGFTKLGVIPGGFLNGNGEYEDIIPHYISLT